jgi:hypothetical protein
VGSLSMVESGSGAPKRRRIPASARSGRSGPLSSLAVRGRGMGPCVRGRASRIVGSPLTRPSATCSPEEGGRGSTAQGRSDTGCRNPSAQPSGSRG